MATTRNIRRRAHLDFGTKLIASHLASTRAIRRAAALELKVSHLGEAIRSGATTGKVAAGSTSIWSCG